MDPEASMNPNTVKEGGSSAAETLAPPLSLVPPFTVLLVETPAIAWARAMGVDERAMAALQHLKRLCRNGTETNLVFRSLC